MQAVTTSTNQPVQSASVANNNTNKTSGLFGKFKNWVVSLAKDVRKFLGNSLDFVKESFKNIYNFFATKAGWKPLPTGKKPLSGDSSQPAKTGSGTETPSRSESGRATPLTRVNSLNVFTVYGGSVSQDTFSRLVETFQQCRQANYNEKEQDKVFDAIGAAQTEWLDNIKNSQGCDLDESQKDLFFTRFFTLLFHVEEIKDSIWGTLKSEIMLNNQDAENLEEAVRNNDHENINFFANEAAGYWLMTRSNLKDINGSKLSRSSEDFKVMRDSLADHLVSKLTSGSASRLGTDSEKKGRDLFENCGGSLSQESYLSIVEALQNYRPTTSNTQETKKETEEEKKVAAILISAFQEWFEEIKNKHKDKKSLDDNIYLNWFTTLSQCIPETNEGVFRLFSTVKTLKKDVKEKFEGLVRNNEQDELRLYADKIALDMLNNPKEYEDIGAFDHSSIAGIIDMLHNNLASYLLKSFTGKYS